MKYSLLYLLIFCTLLEAKNSFLTLTVATDNTDGFRRLTESLEFFEYKFQVLGHGDFWRGGDVKNTIGGGQKVNLLREFLNSKEFEPDIIIMYIDGYDVIMNGNATTVIDKFLASQKRILFGAEGFCWPDPNLVNEYPKVQENEKRFLNSGGFIGYAKDIIHMIGQDNISDDDDDQLFYTKYFLNNLDRNLIGLDTKSEIFQNLNGAENDLKMEFNYKFVVLQNSKTNSTPAVIHGNGPTKTALNRIGNYISGAWSSSGICLNCNKDVYNLPSVNRHTWPRVLVYITINRPTPFINEFLSKIQKLTYPKELLHLIIHNTEVRWKKLIEDFIEANIDEYATIASTVDAKNEVDGISQAISTCKKIVCSHFFMVDAIAHLDEDESLIFLLGLNRTIISPMLTRENSLYANFWGEISKDGFYERSDDYIQIVEDQRIGIWNVPYVSSCILFTYESIAKINVSMLNATKDFELALPEYLRGNGQFMWTTNIHNYGHLIDNENYHANALFPEMYEAINNPKEWKRRYLHPYFYNYLESKQLPQQEWENRYFVNADVSASEFYIRQPCPDVFWFPLFSEKFTHELVSTCEESGLWSLGKNQDSRLPGGYENVPTDDVHMSQIGWHENWIHILSNHIQPIQKRIFLGYNSNPVKAPLSFVVRYDKSIQDHLRAHHDSSTYTLDIALNKIGKDYTAGGVRFIRYNCSLVDTPLGWTLMFPGRLTHLHEGLKINSGKRYIFVSFVDP